MVIWNWYQHILLNSFRLLTCFFKKVCGEILNREPPYIGYHPVQACTAVLTEGLRITLPSSIPQNLHKLIWSCFETEPEKRPTFQQISSQLQTM